ncbi:MAG: T9SS type A sorting domain-containing protein, partial [Sphingomonadales bacterium]
SLTNLTINSGITLTINASKELTVNGTLTNNGTLTLENGATLVQGTSSTSTTATGNGYVVKQVVTGSGNSTPNGRGWYIGSPVNGANSNVFNPTASSNLLYHWRANQSTPAWAQITAGAESALEVGKGYLIRMGSNTTLNFAANTLNNAPTSTPINVLCYRQSATVYQGYNLVANPFPSYLDWDVVHAANSSSFESTIWYRSANGNTMVFDTYAAPGGVGTSNYGGQPVSKYIPPMQGYWVRLNSSVTAGSSPTNLTLTNAARSHYAGGAGAGLKSSAQDFPMFLRLNFLQDTKKDQVILYMRPEASNDFDSYDAEKMFVSGYPQIYNQLASRKLVINGMKNSKKVTTIPLTLEVPTAGTYTLQAEEFNASEGLILLEDKQEGIIQDLTFNDTYVFNANSGVLSNRFFIRFILPDASINATGPSNQWVEEEPGLNEAGSISIGSNGKGKITIQQDIDYSTTSVGLVQLSDQSGKIVFTGTFSGEQSIFELEHIASGVYFVKATLNGKEEIKKVFIQF